MTKSTLALNYAAIYTAPPPAGSERDALIESQLPQIKYIADRIAVRLPFNIDKDDLISAGVLGLLDAVEKFDPSRGVQFKTYAELRIRGAILDSLRDLDWVPRSVRHRAREVDSTYARLEQQLGRPATEEEAALALGISLKEFQTLLGELRWLTIMGLDRDDEDQPARQIPDDLQHLPSAEYERTELRERLAEAIDRLPERERQVVALYYLEELTMKEIGEVLGITESRVSQVHTQAMLHLRATMAVFEDALS